MARIIALVNQKGGVGKSTTAVNLGAALAMLGSRVLVVDTDPQGNSTTGLGIEKPGLKHDIYHALMQEIPLERVIVETEVPNLWLAPATINLAGADVELVAALSRETRLRQALGPVASRYDFVLIDSPPSLGLLTINALTAADDCIIPVQAEFYALEGLAQLTSVIWRVRDALNPTLHVSGVLVTMFDGRTRLSLEVIRELQKYFPREVFKTQVPRNVRLSEAPSYGKPAILFDLKSRGAQAYLAVAREMLEPAAARA
ncbi:MAG: ParA family protein [Candidatus Eremiobacteraeota bacterium]|nr:ParA family protein [Candidatus Eremiobacteraeota bacterium]MBV8497869.1 ParA family protein [Candidatus Eremiobacteraeota bacterium]